MRSRSFWSPLLDIIGQSLRHFPGKDRPRRLRGFGAGGLVRASIAAAAGRDVRSGGPSGRSPAASSAGDPGATNRSKDSRGSFQQVLCPDVARTEKHGTPSRRSCRDRTLVFTERTRRPCSGRGRRARTTRRHPQPSTRRTATFPHARASNTYPSGNSRHAPTRAFPCSGPCRRRS